MSFLFSLWSPGIITVTSIKDEGHPNKINKRVVNSISRRNEVAGVSFSPFLRSFLLRPPCAGASAPGGVRTNRSRTPPPMTSLTFAQTHENGPKEKQGVAPSNVLTQKHSSLIKPD